MTIRITPSPPSPVDPAVGRPLLRLHGNEGSRPGAGLLDGLADRLPELLREYPDPRPLEARLAATFGVDPERVVVTAGADDALDRCCRLYLAGGRELLLPEPGFETLERLAVGAGGRLARVPWRDGAFPRRRLIDRVGAETGLVALTSPNNPTGEVLTAADLRAVAEAVGEQAWVLFDQVYREYADVDLTEVALGLDRVLLVGTLSKAWGLAGCRVGYLVAPSAVAARLRAAGNPYPTSGLSLALAEARLGQEDELAAHVAAVRSERERLAGDLDRRGIAVPSSEANFLFPDLGRRAGFVEATLARAGILVRRFPDRPGLETRLRITLPGEERDFERLRAALDLCLAPEALLFDLDHVVADVRRSYDRAILATALDLGVDLEIEEVREARLAGDANDDWQLTRKLVAAHGVSAELATVREVFQNHYLGTGERPGLRELEVPLVEPVTLRAWAGRWPLAVVTGRPRAEAEWFLERWDLAPVVSCLVAREDAPLKPDPAPVTAALECLGVGRAWMLGDTPDDMAAALGAGALAIGVLAQPTPPDAGSRASAASALAAAGAVALVDGVAELRELLP